MDILRKNERYLCVGIIIILFIIILSIIVINIFRKNEYIHEYLQGLWIADEAFCNDSGIDGMVIYIGDGTDTHNAYIIMYSADAIIVEKKISIDLPSSLNFIHSSKLKKQIDLQDLDCSELDDIHLKKIMPLSLQMHLNLVDNSMVWQDDDDTVYARLYKDSYSSVV